MNFLLLLENELKNLCGNISKSNTEIYMSIIALTISFFTLISTILFQYLQLKNQQKTLQQNTEQQYFSNLVELYRLGIKYTSNIYSFETEINELIILIRKHVDVKTFDKVYHNQKYDELRKTISYFDFVQNMVRNNYITREEIYRIINFPIKLYENLNPLIKYEKENGLHDFDRFSEFCKEYINFMKKVVKSGSELS